MKKINLKSLIKESQLGTSTGQAPEKGEHGDSTKFSSDAKRNFLEIVSTYNKYQEMMDRKSDIITIAETLSAITEAATELAVNEGDDWFDKHTVKRNMGELKKLGSQFDKCAREASSLDQRMTGLYEDMGHLLSRYYKIGEITEDEMKSRLGMTNEGRVNEGRKRFYQQDGIGKSKYTISFHDGKQTHKDGSDFYGIRTFKSKPELEKFRKELLSKGYKEDSGFRKESVNKNIK